MKAVYRMTYYYGMGDSGKEIGEKLESLASTREFKSLNAVVHYCVEYALANDPVIARLLKQESESKI